MTVAARSRTKVEVAAARIRVEVPASTVMSGSSRSASRRPFRLTGLLLPGSLRETAPRVVTVSSFAHTIGGPVPIENLDPMAGCRPIRADAKTKLANILFTRALQRRAGDRLLATTCHPGASHTNPGAAASLNMRLMGLAATPAVLASVDR